MTGQSSYFAVLSRGIQTHNKLDACDQYIGTYLIEE